MNSTQFSYELKLPRLRLCVIYSPMMNLKLNCRSMKLKGFANVELFSDKMGPLYHIKDSTAHSKIILINLPRKQLFILHLHCNDIFQKFPFNQLCTFDAAKTSLIFLISKYKSLSRLFT